MKTSIKTQLDAYVHDNWNYIRDNGGNAAEFILESTEIQENGWLWFLTDEEIEEFETGQSARHIQEIRKYVNANYNYTV